MTQHIDTFLPRRNWRHALPVLACMALAIVPLVGLPVLGFTTGMMGVWPLGLTGGIAAAAYGLNIALGRQSATILNSAAPEKAAAPLQEIATNLFRKAGLTTTPEVRLVQEGSRELKFMQKTVGVVPFAPGRDKIVPILLGRQVTGYLTTEELSAMLAYAAARQHGLSPATGFAARASGALETGLIAGGVLTLNLPVLALALGAGFARRCLLLRAQHYDDVQIDRTATFLFPHKTALASAFGKVKEMILTGHRSDFSPIRQAGHDTLHRFMRLDFGSTKRAERIETARQEVVEYYQNHDLPMNCRDILSRELKAAWDELRVPHYWEKVRIPLPRLAAGEVPDLKAGWARKDEEKHPCDCGLVPEKILTPQLV